MLDGERLPYDRVPVIFNLSSWQPKRQSLRDWMTDFLLLTYPDLFDTDQKRKLAGEYAAAVQNSGVLHAAVVIELYEPAFDDVATYLLQQAKWRSVVGRMRYAPGIVRPGLGEDDWGAYYLRLALQTPLMVSLDRLAYNGTDADPSDL